MDETPCDPLEPTNVFCRRPQQDSDDSENEGGLGNVTRVVMRPPGHSGKAKRGHLCFDASFETGNLGRVDLISEFEYDLFIRPDTCNPRLRLWFNFTVDNIRADQRVIFNIVNLSKSKNLFRDGMTPIVKSTSRPKWQRMPSKHVYYYRSPEHHNHYVLSFAFGFDREEDVYQFALSFPYSYSRYQAHAEVLEKRHFTFLKREELAKSVQQRRVDLLTLSHPQNLRPGRRQRVVCVLCRIHPGEAPTSYVCQGLIDFLVSSHPIALALREYVVFKIVPMLNPDGVFLGNYRSTVMGFDLNRTWHQSSPWAHPSLHAVHEMLADLDRNKNVDLDFVLDLHAHSSLLGAFIYGNTYEDVYRYERHIVFPKLLAQNAEDYNPANTMYNRDPNKAGTARRYFCAALKESVNCYTLEVSLFGYQRPNGPGIIPYTEEAYFRLGRNVARTFYDYYKAIGVMPSSLPTSLLHGSSSNPASSARKATAASGSGTSTNSAPSAMLHLRGVATASSMASTGSTEEDDEEDDDDLDEESSSPVTRTTRPLRLSLPSPTPWSILQFPSNHSQSDVPSAPCSFALPSRPLGSPKHNIGQRTLPGRKVGGGGVIGRTTRSVSGNQVASSRVQLNQPPPPPSLTIIDFNQLTRGGLELATGRGHGASRNAQSRSRRVGTSRRATSSSPRRVRRHRSCSGLHARRPAV